MVENNFYKAVKPTINICKFLGILPFSYENNGIVVFRYNLPYNILLLMITIWLGVEMSMLVLKQNIVAAITDLTLITVNQIQFIVTLIKAIVSKQTWLDFALAMLQTDKLLQEMKIQLPDRKLKIKMYTGFTAIVLFVGFGLSVQTNLNDFESYIEFIYWYTCVIFNSILSCCTGLYIMRIRDCFKGVNSVLKERADARRVFEVGLKDLLCSTCITHHSLTKLMRKFNECFGIILLATITTSFLMIITILLENYRAVKTHDIVSITGTMIVFLAYLTNNIFLCHLCEATVDEVYRTFSIATSFSGLFLG